MAKVGIFFYVNNKLITECSEIDESEKYGDFKVHKNSHFHVWEKKYYDIFKKPYDFFPRGRVLYNYKEDFFKIFIDPCINKENIIAEIKKVFDLPENFIVDSSDTHYVCSKCNKNFNL